MPNQCKSPIPQSCDITSIINHLFVIEDNNFAVLTSKDERRDWKINNVAKSFNIESADVNDNPLNIYKSLKNYKFKKPFLINVRTNRLYWHSGAGKDRKNVFDRLEDEKRKLGRKALEIYLKNNLKINNLWKKLLEIQ